MTLGMNLAHGGVVTSGAALFWLARPGSSLFSYHPALMSLGVLVLGFESVLLLKDRRVPRKSRITVHWLTSALGLFFAVLGFQAVYRVKDYNNLPHFSTWHGLLGIISMAILTIQVLGGIPTLYRKNVSRVTGVQKKLIVELHEIGSLTSGIFTNATILVAFFSDWISETAPGLLWWVLLLLVVYPHAYFGKIMNDSKQKKIQNREKNKKKNNEEGDKVE